MAVAEVKPSCHRVYAEVADHDLVVVFEETLTNHQQSLDLSGIVLLNGGIISFCKVRPRSRDCVEFQLKQVDEILFACNTYKAANDRRHKWLVHHA